MRRIRMTLAALLLVIVVISLAAWRFYLYEEQQGVKTAYTNPVFEHDAPDPTVIKAEDGYYYAVTTQSQYEGSFIPLPILRSKDLVHWEMKGSVFTVEQVPSWATYDYMWAPHLTFYNDKYYVYYSTKVNDGDPLKGMGIGVAVADHPLGPYKDYGGPVVWGTGFEKIDPFVLDDGDGKRYLYWGSDKQPIYVQQLADDGFSVIGEEKAVVYSGVQSREMYDALVEGPWVVKRDDYYYMFYSGDYCCMDNSGQTAHYAVMVARAQSPEGPFEAYPNNPMLEKNENFLAPGHNAVIQDEAGVDWLLYHAYNLKDVSTSGRVLMLDRIEWKDGWPIIHDGSGPSSAMQQDGPVTNH
ncbi:family 43 glycosylhydrolase [Paenibacillus sp. LHD-117]|uniref:glycoside hydrolase family 43 protein n=1 Tax=Paenibacillus sp. LHD-117 TaxID=3071412 RepID=UPI0027E150A2|nr:family 43 glycosylhydrolase [Paenibacillus sp. LHD-117]MDQ6423145.1 family 43 glycosylhydrolase [Paenibacillus sp. LHD-117]